MAGSETRLIIYTLLSLTAFAAVIVFNALDGIPNNGIFNNTIPGVSKKYETEIVPAGYAFGIWYLIYLWQAAWLAYALSTICRTNARGIVMMNPVVLPEKFHTYWIFACAGTVLWMFAWDREQLLLSAVFLILITLGGFAALFVNCGLTLLNTPRLEREAMDDLICIRVLVQNGLDLFFSWTTVASLVGMSIALTYDPAFNTNLTSEDSSVVCLAALGLIVVVWSFLENTKLFPLFKYVYSWYFVLIWALSALIAKNPDASNTVTAISIALLCVSIVCLGIKLAVFFTTPRAPVKYEKFGTSTFKK